MAHKPTDWQTSPLYLPLCHSIYSRCWYMQLLIDGCHKFIFSRKSGTISLHKLHFIAHKVQLSGAGAGVWALRCLPDCLPSCHNLRYKFVGALLLCVGSKGCISWNQMPNWDISLWSLFNILFLWLNVCVYVCVCLCTCRQSDCLYACLA